MNRNRVRQSLALLVGMSALLAAACSGGSDDTAANVASGGAGETSVGAALPEGNAAAVGSAPAPIEAASPGGVLVRAAAQATEAQSYRYDMEFGISGLPDMAGLSLNFEATGEADAENERARVAMDFGPILGLLAMDGLTPAEQAEMDEMFGDGTLEMIVSADTIYLRWPAITAMAGITTPWVSLDQSLLGEEFMPSHGASSFGYDPSMTLAFIESLENVEEVGAADVRGVATTHYRGTVTWDSIIEQLPAEERELLEAEMQPAGQPSFPNMPIEVWVDEDNLIRRYAIALDLAQFATDLGAPAGHVTGTFTFAYELYDFGEPIVVDLPAASEVTALTEELFFGSPLPTY